MEPSNISNDVVGEQIFETSEANSTVKNQQDDLEVACREEFESIKTIYADDDITYKEAKGCLKFTIKFWKATLKISTSPGYPVKAPSEIRAVGFSIPTNVSITSSLVKLVEEKRGTEMIFDLVDEMRTIVQDMEYDFVPVFRRVSISHDFYCFAQFTDIHAR